MTYEEYMKLLAQGKVPKTMKFSGGNGAVSIQAKHEDGDKSELRRFTMQAYNGGVMTVGFFGDIVIDLQGLSVTAKQRPILANHDPLTPVGHTVGADGKGNGIEILESSIVASGVFSVPSMETDKIVASSDNGLEWQASVGVNPTKLIFVDDDVIVEANGQEFTGPLIVARESELKEISFVALGADDTTTTKVAANVAEFKETELNMKFKEWLKACGHDESKLDAKRLEELKANFEAFQINAKKTETEVETKVTVIEAKKTDKVIDVQSEIKAGMATMQAELLEVNKIATLCAGDIELHEEATSKGWSSEQVAQQKELRQLRAERDSNVGGFNVGVGSNGKKADSKEMVIAMLRAGGYDEDKLVKEYGEKLVQASDDSYGQRLGLQESMVIAARQNGYSGRSHSVNSDTRGYFEAAFATQRGIQAGTSFGTMDLSGILSNVANKFFIDGFNDVESTWEEVASVRNVKDFKEVSSYSLTGDMNYELVGPGGEIKSADTGEEKYTNQADTYAKMYGINRTNLINDDLDALSTIPFKLGRGGALKFNLVFWTEFLNNAAFFTVGRANLTSGAALSIDELTAMTTAFRLLKDPDGNPMGTKPAILLVGAENETLAEQLFGDQKIVSGAGSAQLDGNPHRTKYRPVVSTYLSDLAIGGSATGSYLLADPRSVAVIEAAFLNGVRTPTVETAQARFDTLGIDMRGFHDFGVNKQEYRGGVKSVGV